MTRYAIACILSSLLIAHASVVVAAPLSLAADDTVSSVLAAQKGNRVTVKLRSGEELTGTVSALSGSAVQLSELAGKEFYDAVVAMDAVAAVVIRTRDK